MKMFLPNVLPTPRKNDINFAQNLFSPKVRESFVKFRSRCHTSENGILTFFTSSVRVQNSVLWKLSHSRNLYTEPICKKTLKSYSEVCKGLKLVILNAFNRFDCVHLNIHPYTKQSCQHHQLDGKMDRF